MNDDAIERLTQLHGIGASYHDFRNRPRPISLDSKLAVLAAMEVSASDARAVDAAISNHDTVHWMRMLPPVIVVTRGERATLGVSVPLDLKATSASWSIQLESDELRAGSCRLNQLSVVERGETEGRKFVRVELVLPQDLPLGYHQVTVTLDTGLSGESRLIVAPDTCYEPPILQKGERVWGIAVQLYSLRSSNNWGMGDFHDLRDLIELSAPLGCGIVGLNPLHALMPANPAHISPYSPSSREFLNVLYIAIPQVPEFSACEAAMAHVKSAGFQAMLAELRSLDKVDYVRVAAAKFVVLRQLYEHFRTTHLTPGTPRADAFRKYVESRGEPLRLHAIYDALDAHWRLQGPQYWGWPSWPDEYREPASSSVEKFARERVQEVEYFLYLQWLAEEQLSGAQQLATRRGMSLGLYGDIAVGANPGGSETWANRHLYRLGASVGAPPDALALKGQDWGIPPQDPAELRSQLYEPFIVMIRNNMRAVSALRLDHAMTLFRLWWVPRGLSSAEGAYVHYPLQDLIAILALESHRNECVVIGEDLGTVPEEVHDAMEQYRAYHYKVLFFERSDDGVFKPPAEYIPHALATVTTHDLPTLRGWWEATDIGLRDQLNLYPSVEVREEVQRGREAERVAMMHALVAQRLWYWQSWEPLPSYSPALARAIHAYLGLSLSNIAMMQIEDLIGMPDAVNIPGTDKEHANWQRKVTLRTDEIFGRDDVRDMLDAMDQARNGDNPNG